jgi:hypothetical protein
MGAKLATLVYSILKLYDYSIITATMLDFKGTIDLEVEFLLVLLLLLELGYYYCFVFVHITCTTLLLQC